MQGFKEYCQSLHEEVQWTKSLFDHLFTVKINDIQDINLKKKFIDAMHDNTDVANYSFLIPDNDKVFQLPLVPALIERVVGSVVTYGIHASSPKNLENLISLQGKKSKQISVFTTDEEERMSSGVWGGGGVYSVLKGNVYAGGSTDIMSIVDKQGRRLVDLGPNSELLYSDDYRKVVKSPEYKNMYKELKTLRNGLTKKLLVLGRKTLQNKQYLDRAIDTNSSLVNGSIKRDYIKKYIDGAEKILMKYKEVFAKMYISWARSQSKSWDMVADSYDEMVMGNFQIVKVFVDMDHKEEFIIHFGKIKLTDEDKHNRIVFGKYPEGVEIPTWEDVQKKVGFKFPVEFIRSHEAYQLLPKFLEKNKK
jgi:hypothetical protein